MVGCETSKLGEISHTHAWPPGWLAIKLNNRSRTGSPSALNMAANSTACGSPSAVIPNGGQQLSVA